MAVAKGVTRLVRRLRNIVTMISRFICAGTVKPGI
jgi:hypothetical protein